VNRDQGFTGQCADQVATGKRGEAQEAAERRSAAIAVCDRAAGRDEARMLLEMLGLDQAAGYVMPLMAGRMPGDRAVPNSFRRTTKSRRRG
jgi:hypothetical protein